MKKISTILFATVILLTSTICFAAKGYVQNGYWMGDSNYPVIKYYGANSIEVANKKTVQNNYLLQPSNERVIKIETETVQLADNLSDSDAFYFKVVGNNIYFVNHNSSAGMPKINWKVLDKNNNPEAWSAYQIAVEVLNYSANNSTNNLVPLSESGVNSEAFYLMVQLNDIALNMMSQYNIKFTNLTRNTKLDLPNENLIAYNCAYGISGQKNPSGGMIFYENKNNRVERIKLQPFSSDINFQVTGIVLTMTFLPIGLDESEINSLLKNQDAVKNVWCKLKKHRIMMAENDNVVLLFASEK